MERIRRYYLLILVAILLLLTGYCAYMEHHFATWTMVDCGWSEERILKEMPDIAVTDEDRALADFLLALPEVQTALKETAESREETAIWTAENPVTLVSEGLPGEKRTVMELAVSRGNIVYFSCSEGPQNTKAVYYTFFADRSYPMRKMVGTSRMKNDRRVLLAIYENENGKVTKSVEKRVWFAWLLDSV